MSPIKNLVVLSIGILFLYTAYAGLMTLQSSMNHDEGLGVASLSVMHGALTLSSIFLPAILMKKLGCKWTIVASMMCYLSFTLGNFYPSWPTLILGSVLLGVGAGPLWAAKSIYITAIGNKYAEMTGKASKDVVNQYFGIFFFIVQTCRIWGNLISSLIFQFTTSADDYISVLNNTGCGAGSCPVHSFSSLNATGPSLSNSVLYTILGAYTGCGVIGILIILLCLDQINLKNEHNKDEDQQSLCSIVFSTFKHLKDKRQCLLIPITMLSGLEQGFITGDYTRDYVTCAIGIRMVGFVIICSGVTNSISAIVFGKISQYTGRFFIFVLGAIINISCIVVLLLWKPHADQIVIFFVISGVWAISDSVWQAQVSSLYGVLFEKNKEAAFANFCLWEAVGFVIAYAYSSFLCVYMKLYILLCVIALGFSMYVVVEYMEFTRPSSDKQEPKEAPTLNTQ
ncbi:protein unc-93 homolog A-like [Spea bombifrons]|uniref:protein unc-93 homolog A-like n=1 Tax=Spea bombifrons TaxID=233779 RepID=UPI00234B1AAA|nr:protein unc-93 homolog A-like [Spea bombifrons]